MDAILAGMDMAVTEDTADIANKVDMAEVMDAVLHFSWFSSFY